MPGYPGTPRFGDYDQKHKMMTNAEGDSVIALQDDGDFDEIHFIYNNGQKARDVGSTPGREYDKKERQYDAPANHDGWFGGDAHLVNLDERKVLENYIYNVKIKSADEEQNISQGDEASA